MVKIEWLLHAYNCTGEEIAIMKMEMNIEKCNSMTIGKRDQGRSNKNVLECKGQKQEIWRKKKEYRENPRTD